MGLKVGTVKLEKYDSNWNEMFREEKEKLEKIFGSLAIKIEHIGSTSIEGLSSKPIIDIAVPLRKLEDFEQVKHEFEKEPYSVKEDRVCDGILIRKGNEENRTHFIHVMEIESKRYKDTIKFRDYMRTHLEAVKEYEELKVELAEKYANDRKMYTSSKNEFIQNILKMASETN